MTNETERHAQGQFRIAKPKKQKQVWLSRECGFVSSVPERDDAVFPIDAGKMFWTNDWTCRRPIPVGNKFF